MIRLFLFRKKRVRPSVKATLGSVSMESISGQGSRGKSMVNLPCLTNPYFKNQNSAGVGQLERLNYRDKSQKINLTVEQLLSELCISINSREVLLDGVQPFFGHFGLIRLGVSFDDPSKQISGIRLIPKLQKGKSLFEQG